MKCITLIVHSSAKQSLADLFHNINEIERFTMTDCEGYDEKDLEDPVLSTGDLVVGYVPRVRIELNVADASVASVLAELKKPKSLVVGLGVYWITDIVESGSL